MPLTKSGKEVIASMKEQYGEKKGNQVFYASINKRKAGSPEWEEKSKRNIIALAKKKYEERNS
jgi:hypothetical protein